ncbi:phage tail protein [Variovorax sp. IB41]|uniref:phage tail protein n=1 Tax=Variovorax sp. IB41 TaxID=2779370 RepID=UPI0018E8D080|nr:phage tail protein [Variovorax sp. IB41]MBJ2155258.1 tail fiber protein [Variovorax sp. IB41]
MPALPLKAEISSAYPVPSSGQARVGFGKLWEYLAGLFGITGNAADARAALGAQIEPGMVFFHAANTPPPGALKANGAAVSRTTYAALFAVIGTTFGVGDGTTTFNLPELRGEHLRAWDDSRGIDAARAFGSAQADCFQGHGHAVATKATSAGATAFFYNNSSTVNTSTGTATAATVFEAQAALASGNGTPRVGNETRPRNVALLACIKY